MRMIPKPGKSSICAGLFHQGYHAPACHSYYSFRKGTCTRLNYDKSRLWIITQWDIDKVLFNRNTFRISCNCSELIVYSLTQVPKINTPPLGHQTFENSQFSFFTWSTVLYILILISLPSHL